MPPRCWLATHRAAALLGLNGAALARVLGVSEASVSRPGAWRARPAARGQGRRAGPAAGALYRSLDALVGNDLGAAALLMRSPNDALGGVPATLILSAQGLVAAVAYPTRCALPSEPAAEHAALARRVVATPLPAAPARCCGGGVEAQHRVATLRLVDSPEDQATLERLLETSKPPLPEAAQGLHHLLATPFRYRSPYGSRFRAGTDPGVWYGGEGARDRLHRSRLLALAFPDGQRRFCATANSSPSTPSSRRR